MFIFYSFQTIQIDLEHRSIFVEKCVAKRKKPLIFFNVFSIIFVVYRKEFYYAMSPGLIWFIFLFFSFITGFLIPSNDWHRNYFIAIAIRIITIIFIDLIRLTACVIQKQNTYILRIEFDMVPWTQNIIWYINFLINQFFYPLLIWITICCCWRCCSGFFFFGSHVNDLTGSLNTKVYSIHRWHFSV